MNINQIKIKKLVGTVHLWLGLSSGILVFLISISGCLLAFEKEIQDAMCSYRFIEPQPKAYLLPSQLKTNAIKYMGETSVHSIEYNREGSAAIVTFYSRIKETYKQVYVNPYTAQVLHAKNLYTDFFFLVKMFHYCLLLPIAIGQPIVASATLVFFVMVVTGIILWWPKNKSAAKQRFWFKWNDRVKWKRKNYDLHNILGFYACWLALVLVITGLFWGFEWFRNGYYAAVSGGKTKVQYYEPKSDSLATPTLQMPAIDQAYLLLAKENANNKASIEVHVPETASSSVVCVVNTGEGTYWKSDYRYFDQYTLKELEVNSLYGKLKNASKADILMRMNYDIHVGAIGGIAGKILAFLISLTCASLPITGFMIWRGRRKKSERTVLRARNEVWAHENL